MKPSEIAPHVSAIIKKFCDRYLDQDYIRCIEGGIDVAVELNKQPLDMICFTGSTFVGKIIAETAAKNLTYCILELGGKCPLVVHETADLQHTADKVCWAKFSNAG
jgi:aldehyde dehydrogenase (NAD+)